MSERVQIVEDNLIRRLAEDDLPDGHKWGNPLADNLAVSIFKTQCLTRALDIHSRILQKQKAAYYTIGSSGHEGMAAVAHALQVGDPALLHYRDAAFQLARADQAEYPDMVQDMLYSFACSSLDPVSGGRHKVLGSKALNIPPQTSTIASHLPKALGLAFAIGHYHNRKAKIDPHGFTPNYGKQALCMASFGDASLNHSTAQGTINSSGWISVQGIPLPLLMVCEDNGIGISVKTPKGWVANSMRHRTGVQYFYADGLDINHTYHVTCNAVEYVRTHQKPAFLHLKLVRLYGHAGADVAEKYLSRQEIENDEANDPLLHSARILRALGYSSKQCLELYQRAKLQVASLAEGARDWPRLQNDNQVMESITPKPNANAPKPRPTSTKPDNKPLSMGKLLNQALARTLEQYPHSVMLGEDIGRKGGVYGITQRLQQEFGKGRVIDSLLDEQSIFGMAIGMAQYGFLPIAEIQFLAYLHNAEDQLRGEAATLSFFSNKQFVNPMIIRIAGLGYQKGFGGHFHNDNSLAVLRDIPGIVMLCPSNGKEAVLLWNEAVRLAVEEQKIVVFLEPIALYNEKDLYAPNDQGWLNSYPSQQVSYDQVGTAQNAPEAELAIISYANGYRLSLQAAKCLDVSTRVIDLRCLSPLPTASLSKALLGARRILVVDECRDSGNLGEGLSSFLGEHPTFSSVPKARISAKNSFIATGPAYAATMPSKHSILQAAQSLLTR